MIFEHRLVQGAYEFFDCKKKIGYQMVHMGRYNTTPDKKRMVE